MSLPCDLVVGDILMSERRKIRFEADLGEGDLHFTDVRTGARLRVPDPTTGELVTTTTAWLLREVRAGRISKQRPRRRKNEDRRGDMSHVDEDAADSVDPRYSWRKTWVRQARQLSVKSEPACERFIKSHGERIVAEYRDRKGRAYNLPGASTLRRWIANEADEFQPAALISLAGRPRGQSPLTDQEDDAVTEAAIYCWAEPGASVRDGHVRLENAWNKLPADQKGEKVPTYETVRLRFHSLATYETVKAKFGQDKAERMFGAVGESFDINRAFEKVFVDGFELEQVAVFGEDWQLPGGKLRGVLCTDAFSTFVFDPAIYAGPHRDEMSMEALARVMTPPDFLTEEELAEDEHIGWAFGIPESWLPDNEKVIINRAYIPALTDLGSRLELPATYHSDAKAFVEWMIGHIKARMRGLPGTVLSPRHKKDLKRNPVNEAELTMHQIRTVVRGVIWDHNHTPVERLNWRSPYQVLIASMMAEGTASLEDPNRIRSMLGKTVPDAVIVNDGIEHDGVQYRGPEIEGYLKRNYHTTRRADQLDNTAKCICSIRTIEANLDYILLWDPHPDEMRFIVLWSTQPTYTAYLSRWEHDKYREMAKQRREKFDTQAQRVKSRMKSLEIIDKEAPKAAFRRRAVMFALAASEEVRQLSGARAKRKTHLRFPEHFVIVNSSIGMRGDPGTPPPGASKRPPTNKVIAPRRDRGRGVSPDRDTAQVEHDVNGTGIAMSPDQGTMQTHESKGEQAPRDWDSLGSNAPDDYDPNPYFDTEE